MTRMEEISRYKSAEEMYQLGKEWRDGTNGKVVMPTTAIKAFIQAGNRGHVEAQYDLACMYENGIGSEVDIEQAIDWYTAAAGWGHDAAQEALERLSMNTSQI